MTLRVTVQIQEADPDMRFAVLSWAIARLVEALQDAPAQVTIRIERE